MLIRTHLAITIFAIILLLPNVKYGMIFCFVALAATFIPDIDSRYSVLGRKRINRILQFFTKHRGVTHSFLFLILLTLILLLIYPVLALGFFLGYGLHLFTDCFTVDGISPFYPLIKAKSRGNVSSGGRTEVFIFVIFLILDIGLFFIKVF